HLRWETGLQDLPDSVHDIRKRAGGECNPGDGPLDSEDQEDDARPVNAIELGVVRLRRPEEPRATVRIRILAVRPEGLAHTGGRPAADDRPGLEDEPQARASHREDEVRVLRGIEPLL